MTFSLGMNQVAAFRSTWRHSAISSSPMRQAVDKHSQIADWVSDWSGLMAARLSGAASKSRSIFANTP